MWLPTHDLLRHSYDYYENLVSLQTKNKINHGKLDKRLSLVRKQLQDGEGGSESGQTGSESGGSARRAKMVEGFGGTVRCLSASNVTLVECRSSCTSGL